MHRATPITLVCTLLAGAALYGLPRLLPRHGEPPRDGPAGEAPAAEVRYGEAKRALQAAAAKTLADTRKALDDGPTAHGPLLPANVTARHGPAAVAAVKSAYLEMLSAQGLYNVDAVRQRLLDQLASSPEQLAVAESTLSTEEFARSAFGERQAEARYFSSQALQHAARGGNDAPLLRVARSIAREAAHDGLSPGRRQDLEELLLGWARLRRPSDLEEADSSVASALGFDPSLPDDVRALYKDAIFMALYRHIGLARAQQAVDRIFAG